MSHAPVGERTQPAEREAKPYGPVCPIARARTSAPCDAPCIWDHVPGGGSLVRRRGSEVLMQSPDSLVKRRPSFVARIRSPAGTVPSTADACRETAATFARSPDSSPQFPSAAWPSGTSFVP